MSAERLLKGKTENRIWELDFIRGFCICLMIMDHTLYDLAYVFRERWFPDGASGGILYALCEFAHSWYFPWVVRDFFWCTTVFCFIFICGISCSFSRSNLKRGLKLAGVAIALSIFTYGADYFSGQNDQFTIRFGVLHMLAACILLYCLLRPLSAKWRFVIAFAAIAPGLVFSFRPMATDVQFFALFVHTTSGFRSADYFPLLPWLGYFLLGTLVGPALYKNRTSLFKTRVRDHACRPILFVGRHSLFFYLFHQPLVYLVLLSLSFFLF